MALFDLEASADPSHHAQGPVLPDAVTLLWLNVESARRCVR